MNMAGNNPTTPRVTPILRKSRDCDSVNVARDVAHRDAAEAAEDNAAVVARLRAALADPALTDVLLVSEKDSTQIAAAHLLLASCSPVFSRMLAGSFAEGVARAHSRRVDHCTPMDSLASVVYSAYSGDTLSALVSYAATNDANALWTGTPGILSEMLEASEYYCIEGLHSKAKRALISRAKCASQACEVLEAVWERRTAEHGFAEACHELPHSPRLTTSFPILRKSRHSVDGGETGFQGRNFSAKFPSDFGQIADVALATIDEFHSVALLHCGCLGEGAMQMVLSSRQTDADEATLFTALNQWACAPDSNGGCAEERQLAAARLINCLSLDLMSATFLRDVVAKSAFVPAQALCDAFQALALAAERNWGFVSRSRNLPVWSSTGGVEYTCERAKHGVELLSCSLSTGRWAWELQVVKLCNAFWVGVATGDVDSSAWLGKQKGGYVYGSNGASSRRSGGGANRSTIRFDTDTFTDTFSPRLRARGELARDRGEFARDRDRDEFARDRELEGGSRSTSRGSTPTRSRHSTPSTPSRSDADAPLVSPGRAEREEAWTMPLREEASGEPPHTRTSTANTSNNNSGHFSSCASGPPLERGPTFTEGDVLRIVLDCAQGTMTVSINGRPPYEAFTGMHLAHVGHAAHAAHVNEREREGANAKGASFRPAVSLTAPGRVCLRKFERLT